MSKLWDQIKALYVHLMVGSACSVGATEPRHILYSITGWLPLHGIRFLRDVPPPTCSFSLTLALTLIENACSMSWSDKSVVLCCLFCSKSIIFIFSNVGILQLSSLIYQKTLLKTVKILITDIAHYLGEYVQSSM